MKIVTKVLLGLLVFVLSAVILVLIVSAAVNAGQKKIYNAVQTASVKAYEDFGEYVKKPFYETYADGQSWDYYGKAVDLIKTDIDKNGNKEIFRDYAEDKGTVTREQVLEALKSEEEPLHIFREGVYKNKCLIPVDYRDFAGTFFPNVYSVFFLSNASGSRYLIELEDKKYSEALRSAMENIIFSIDLMNSSPNLMLYIGGVHNLKKTVKHLNKFIAEKRKDLRSIETVIKAYETLRGEFKDIMELIDYERHLIKINLSDLFYEQLFNSPRASVGSFKKLLVKLYLAKYGFSEYKAINNTLDLFDRIYDNIIKAEPRTWKGLTGVFGENDRLIFNSKNDIANIVYPKYDSIVFEYFALRTEIDMQLLKLYLIRALSEGKTAEKAVENVKTRIGEFKDFYSGENIRIENDARKRVISLVSFGPDGVTDAAAPGDDIKMEIEY